MPSIEVDSAGLNNDAENPVTPENVAWADLIFVNNGAITVTVHFVHRN